MATAYSAPEGYDPPMFTVEDFRDNTYLEKEEAYIQQLAELAKQNGADPLLGEVVRWPRGDGYAMYMVWRIRPLQLVHLAVGDAWQVEDALIRGLRLTDIRQMASFNANLKDLFSRKQVPDE